MCRWVAYFGNPIRPEALLYDTPHSLVEQSRSDRLAGGQPNADGVGLGWYGERETPGLYRSVAPAWGDRNLHELSSQVRSPLFLTHIRAATGTPVEQTNCRQRAGRQLPVRDRRRERRARSVPDDERIRRFSDEARAVVSEPLGDLPGLWHEVPAGTAIV